MKLLVLIILVVLLRFNKIPLLFKIIVSEFRPRCDSRVTVVGRLMFR